MRKWIALTVLAAPLALVAGASRAEAPIPPPPAPLQPPKGVPTISPKVPPKLSLPPYIASARRSLTKGSPTTTRYSGGALSYDVEIVNPQSSDLSTVLVVERLGVPPPLPQVARAPVNVPANGRAFVGFTDASGLADGCSPTQNRLTLESGTSTRTLKVTPSCTFEMTGIDPGAALPPDRRLEQRRGRLSYHSVSLAAAPGSSSAAPPVCGVAIAAQATARNDATTAASNVRLRFSGPNGNGPGVPAAGFDLGAGKERRVDVPSAQFAGHAGSYVLRIEGSGVPTHQPGWYASVERSCELEVSLER